jgi:undecaprenyl diphosphate synthase
MSTDSASLHLAIIPDGNRRWARSQGLPSWKGHERAIENFRAITEWCRKNPRIAVLTVWCFSTENWKRSKAEVGALMQLFESYLRNERTKLREDRTRLLHSGRTDRIPASLAALLREVQEETARDDFDFTLHLALDYGGKDELTRAVNRIGGGKITKETIRAHLDQPALPDIDLTIRTSGEFRTSNFFLWQSAYSEWIFLEKHFPELSVSDLESALQEFDQRQRRYGT